VTIRLYEMEMADQKALQPLFDKQKEYDEEHPASPEKTEIEKVIHKQDKRRGSKDEDELVRAVSMMDGSFSTGDQAGMEEYDEIILNSPDSLKDKETIWPSRGRSRRESGAFITDLNKTI